MRYVLMTLIVLLFSTLSMAEGRAGNGGGGLIVNGNYLTIPEANVSLEGHLMLEVAGLDDVNQALWNLHLSPTTFRRFLPLLNPSTQRTYYAINSLEPAELLELKKVYSKILNVPVEKVVIYAVSDPVSKKTFLLPDYFRLKIEQEASVLFHEWLWILKPDMTYEDVLFGEDLFHRFVLEPDYEWDNLSTFLAQVTGDSEMALFPALARVPRVHAFEGDNVLPLYSVNCINAATTADVRKVCLYDWALGVFFDYGSSGNNVIPMGGHEPNPLMGAIGKYFKLGGDISINVTHIPDGWEKLKVVGVADGVDGHLQFVDADGHSVFELTFPGNK